ncbi:FitA-like ribbon-helix-helix domain-containing protein [Rhizobium ruizarguesonis]|uniref:Plasmid stabilization protein n=1 Tax=Rhizobium ruizarguesonis TaxID=2081791 RepID=A0AB38HV08_9HYPH|nr:plasmid stabilization protein [Rhizobium ruizarguesonis]TCA20327.1 plasmid stabilization protein [Rhizobium leguminosarum bv. viciae]NEI03281.1 plasmid stabilization protein [Rhizobium ruizarguesonis]TAY83891.1 plasmid stabilization protein [Rhizobium ruizarguesonis]TAZ66978.1 plasmid stabilization protein [Rhizobium ruizarguesonis]TAZ90050.1 plasmid stabilization protein [Rhizobium ruizarguesonis]
MASMTIRNLDDGLKQRLRVRAATHGRSMEDEARDILRTALATTEPVARNLADTIRARLQSIGGVELEIPPRQAIRDAPDFDA